MGAARLDFGFPDAGSTAAQDLAAPSTSTDMASVPPDLASSTDLASMSTTDFASPPPDLTSPDLMPPPPVQPGGNCTSSSQCYCYSGCSGTATAYGYCVTDYNYAAVSQGKYCVVAWWTYAQAGSFNGYWFIEFGDQSKVLPGYAPPGNGYIYGCSQNYNETGQDPKIPPTLHLCPNNVSYNYLVAEQ